MKHTSVIHGFKDKLLINPTTVSDFKKALCESIPCDYLRTAPSRQIIANSNQPSRRVTQVRNRDEN